MTSITGRLTNHTAKAAIELFTGAAFILRAATSVASLGRIH
jgi:hypothetical protein